MNQSLPDPVARWSGDEDSAAHTVFPSPSLKQEPTATHQREVVKIRASSLGWFWSARFFLSFQQPTPPLFFFKENKEI